MKSRFKRGQQRKTIPSSQGKIVGSPKQTFMQKPFGKQFNSLCLPKLVNHQMKVNFKDGLKIHGPLVSMDYGCCTFSYIKVTWHIKKSSLSSQEEGRHV